MVEERARRPGKNTDLTYSGGFVVGSDGKITSVLWDSAGVQRRPDRRRPDHRGERPRLSMRDALKQAIKAAAGNGPVARAAGQGRRRLPHASTLDWHGGLRYPRLEKVGKGQGTLDALLAPR